MSVSSISIQLSCSSSAAQPLSSKQLQSSPAAQHQSVSGSASRLMCSPAVKGTAAAEPHLQSGLTQQHAAAASSPAAQRQVNEQVCIQIVHQVLKAVLLTCRGLDAHIAAGQMGGVSAVCMLHRVRAEACVRHTKLQAQ